MIKNTEILEIIAPDKKSVIYKYNKNRYKYSSSIFNINYAEL